MPKFNLVVANPDEDVGDVATREFDWPALPRIGEEISVSTVGSGLQGAEVQIYRIKHWFESSEIEIYCKITEGNVEANRWSFEYLITENGFTRQ
ncbi:MAG: hypothetical protein AAB790_00420 [Patescibacteria group bacterium]